MNLIQYETKIRLHVVHLHTLLLTNILQTLANINGMEMGEYTNDMGIHVKTDVCELTKDRSFGA